MFGVLWVCCATQKMMFSIKVFFSKCDQIRRKLWIWSHLLEKSLMENFPFCAVHYIFRLNYLNFSQLKTNVLYSVLSFFVHLLFFYDTSDGSGIIEIFSVMIAIILWFFGNWKGCIPFGKKLFDVSKLSCWTIF